MTEKRSQKLNLEFLQGSIAHLARGRFRAASGRLPSPGHQVNEDFIGINIAPGENETGDGALLTFLEELRVKQVRVDCGYHESLSACEKLLERLSETSCSILLHLVQPREEARLMPEAKIEENWRTFIARIMHDHGEKLCMVEAGSTVNRRKWAGYSLQGWLAAWSIAFQETKQLNLPLLGPNITDFEPYFNEALLRIMQKRGVLPDIHTDNLFVERAGEPEAWDHKILSRTLKGVLKANLLHKAAVLQAVGIHYGVQKTISTNAFWTLPRIGRIHAAVEQKQADYVARYLTLAAASGKLEQVYWGPLINHREGLVDDGITDYPELELVTFYGPVQGTPDNYRKRPAFFALRQFQQTIPGSRYLGAVYSGDGLEVHQFQRQNERVDLAWCRDGHCASLRVLFSTDDLQQAHIIDWCGEPMEEIPDLITESPIYLHWGKKDIARPYSTATVFSNLKIDHHRPNGQYYLFSDQHWLGMVFAEDRRQAETLFICLHPERINDIPVQETLRHARNRIWKIADPRNHEASLAVKQPMRLRLNKLVLDRYKPSKARRSWNGACELTRRGIDTPLPVAWFERRRTSEQRKNRQRENWYICENAEGRFTARAFFSAFAEGEEEFQRIPQEKFYRALSGFLFNLHQRGVYFRDLSGGNILVDISNREEDPRFSLIDTARARFRPYPVPLRQRLSDLQRACHKLHWPGRERFMRLYLANMQKKFSWRCRMPFYLYDLKAALKRFCRRKK